MSLYLRCRKSEKSVARNMPEDEANEWEGKSIWIKGSQLLTLCLNMEIWPLAFYQAFNILIQHTSSWERGNSESTALVFNLSGILEASRKL